MASASRQQAAIVPYDADASDSAIPTRANTPDRPHPQESTSFVRRMTGSLYQFARTIMPIPSSSTTRPDHDEEQAGEVKDDALNVSTTEDVADADVQVEMDHIDVAAVSTLNTTEASTEAPIPLNELHRNDADEAVATHPSRSPRTRRSPSPVIPDDVPVASTSRSRSSMILRTRSKNPRPSSPSPSKPVVNMPKSKKVASTAIPTAAGVVSRGTKRPKRTGKANEDLSDKAGPSCPSPTKRQRRRRDADSPDSEDLHRYPPRTTTSSGSPKRARDDDEDEDDDEGIEIPTFHHQPTPPPKRARLTEAEVIVAKLRERTRRTAAAAVNSDLSRYDVEKDLERAPVDFIRLHRFITNTASLQTEIDALSAAASKESEDVPKIPPNSLAPRWLRGDFNDEFRRYDRKWDPKLDFVPAEIDQERVDKLTRDSDALRQAMDNLLGLVPELSSGGSSDGEDDDDETDQSDCEPGRPEDPFARYDHDAPDWEAMEREVRATIASRKRQPATRTEVPYNKPGDLSRYDHGNSDWRKLTPAPIDQEMVDLLNSDRAQLRAAFQKLQSGR